jgi:hypothetical protein
MANVEKELIITNSHSGATAFRNNETGKEIVCAFKEHICHIDCAACRVEILNKDEHLPFCLRGSFTIGCIIGDETEDNGLDDADIADLN